MRVRVTISGTDGQPDRCPEFAKPEITIGRRPSNDIVIPDAGASGAHARVMVTGGALTILDLDSTNGTVVNQEPLQGPRALERDDVVEIGEFQLRFVLETDGAAVPADPSPVNGAAPIATDWPAPPPMMDDVQAGAPTAIASAVVAPDDPVPRQERSAMFPRLEPSVPPKPSPVRSPSAPHAGFEFPPGPAPVVLNRAFRSVWLRKRRAIATATAGVREQVAEAVARALQAAGKATELADVGRIGARMVEELVADGPVPDLLAGAPDEVIIVGATRVRINRGGHVSEGPSPFSCSAALEAWASRVCSGTTDESNPRLTGVFGNYSVRGVRGTSGTVVSLRKVSSQGTATLDALVRGGMLSHGIAALLSACIVSRLNVMMCAGPGSDNQVLLAALMACAPTTELKVVVGNADLDAGAFQSATVLLSRDDVGRNAITEALALGPDRLGVDALQWREAGAVTGIVSRSMSYILGVRAASATMGLNLLESMLSGIAPAPTARALLLGSVDVVLTTQLFGDSVTRATALSEPTLDDSGLLHGRDIFALAPGTRTWQFSGVTPRCYEDITRRGFPLDASIFA